MAGLFLREISLKIQRATLVEFTVVRVVCVCNMLLSTFTHTVLFPVISNGARCFDITKDFKSMFVCSKLVDSVSERYMYTSLMPNKMSVNPAHYT